MHALMTKRRPMHNCIYAWINTCVHHMIAYNRLCDVIRYYNAINYSYTAPLRYLLTWALYAGLQRCGAIRWRVSQDQPHSPVGLYAGGFALASIRTAHLIQDCGLGVAMLRPILPGYLLHNLREPCALSLLVQNAVHCDPLSTAI